MVNFFSTPEYVEKLVKDILDSPEIKAILEVSKNKPKLHKDKPTENKEEVENIFLKMWIDDQLERYPKALKAVESYMKYGGKILPIDPLDFMRWFIKYAKETGDYQSVKIQTHHFELYHKEELKAMNKSVKWQGLHNELSEAGYIRSKLEVFDYIMEYKHRPGDKDRIQWLTSKADALYFQEKFNFSMPQLNNCFRSNDGKKFSEGARSTTARNKILINIIKEYLRQLDK